MFLRQCVSLGSDCVTANFVIHFLWVKIGLMNAPLFHVLHYEVLRYCHVRSMKTFKHLAEFDESRAINIWSDIKTSLVACRRLRFLSWLGLKMSIALFYTCVILPS